MASYPVFDPYVLTPLDHSIPPIHLTAFLTFCPNNPSNAILTLEAGVARLISLLPFLGGNVASSTRIPGKKNVLEVQPPTQAFIMQHPIFRARYHENPVYAGNWSPNVAKDLALNEDFIPIPFASAGEDPSPVFRFQANVMSDGILLCLNFHHTVLDGMGFANVIEAFARCCQSPSISLSSLQTSPKKEQESREAIFEAASEQSVETKPLGGSLLPGGKLTLSFMSQDLASRKFVLNPKKIKKLQKECSLLLRDPSGAQSARISRNSIVAGVLWLCFLRARYAKLTGKGEPIPAKSYIIIVSEARSRLRPKIPISYMGNALVNKEVHIPEAMTSSSAKYNYNDRPTTCVEHQDIYPLAYLASSIDGSVESITNEYVREMMSEIVTADDWASRVHPGDINFSSIRSLKIYDLDFGSCLGQVKDFDVPENRIPGVAWVLPIRSHNQSSPWEVRLTLDQGVMENLQNDRLMKWLRSSEVSKL